LGLRQAKLNMPYAKKNIRTALIVYWILVFYIMASLVWWFIELSTQNNQIAAIKIAEINKNDITYQQKYDRIIKAKKSNTAQYLGEGGLFFILIIAGATFVIRAIKKEIKSTTDQQNFMMAITHELKTPIAISKLNLETIQKHKLTDAQYQKILSNTLLETDRLDNLCNNLLLSSQIDASGYKINKEDINFSSLVKECVMGFKNRHTYRDIVMKIAEEINIHADAFLLQIAVNNLIENALKYSSKDKGIKIILEKKETISELKIIDEGTGIPDSEKLAVFTKFYRIGNEATKRAKGTGLGLYLTHKIIKAHDGNITIENNPLGGSIFVMNLKTVV
jgi:two-component system, OmpR family, sensor histidine kinase CiaH